MSALLGSLAHGLAAKLNIALDLTLLCLSVIAASELSTVPFHHAALPWLVAALAATWLLAALVLRYHDAWAHSSKLEDAAVLSLMVLIIGTLMLLGDTRHLKPATFARTGYFIALFWPATLLSRFLLFRPWERRIGAMPSEDSLIVGTGALGKATGVDLTSGPMQRGLLGYLAFPDDHTASHLAAPILGRAADLEAILRKLPVDEVYLAGSAHHQGDALQEAISTCERLGVPFALPAFGFRLNRASALNQQAVTDGYLHFICCEPKPYQMAFKRVFDIVASGFALLALSPLFGLTALAVKITSPGQIFFRQLRSGLHGRPFYMLKFRSMVVGAEGRMASLMALNEQSGPVFKIQNDPRVTPLGRFLRKYSIDELPQLINVLRGQMSVVGPRPPVPAEVEKYQPWQRRRLSVRPGLTCIWQVSGRNQLSFDEWLMLDMRYIDHWSLLSDFSLIARTVPVVLTGRGAS